ncbi:hypothetical protein [Glaciecola sp. MF2-115]|uniref:hypothetical protein n=1 Tax=Glaciecola sp. MF2-115 TaxID=3384827 RepID=UPI0039A0567E
MEIYQIILSSIGGTTIILGGLFGWLGKRHLDRILEYERNIHKIELAKIQNELNIAVEAFKEKSSKNLLVFKSQFEVEFESYKAMWEALDLMTDYIFRLEHLYSEDESSYGDKKAYDEAEDKYIETMRVFRSKKPFVDSAIQLKMVEYGRELRNELFYSAACIKAKKENTSYSYTTERALAGKRLDTLEVIKDDIASMISDRLNNIEIINS